MVVKDESRTARGVLEKHQLGVIPFAKVAIDHVNPIINPEAKNKGTTRILAMFRERPDQATKLRIKRTVMPRGKSMSTVKGTLRRTAKGPRKW